MATTILGRLMHRCVMLEFEGRRHMSTRNTVCPAFSMDFGMAI